MLRTFALLSLLAAASCATSQPAKPDASAADCPSTCASQRDACITKAGPAPIAADPHQQIDKAEYDKRVAQQQAASACADSFTTCSNGCH